MCKRLGITFFYVTHDQEEALTMSDRIVVMKDGVRQQFYSGFSVWRPEYIFGRLRRRQFVVIRLHRFRRKRIIFILGQRLHGRILFRKRILRDIQRRCISRPGDRKRGVQPAGRALRVRRDDSGRRTGLLRTGAVLSCSRGNLTSQDIRRAGRKRCCRDGSSAGRYRVLQRTRGNLHRRRADDPCTPDGGRGENRECVRFAVVQTVLVIKRMQRTVSETAP